MRCITFCLGLAMLVGCVFDAFAQENIHNSKVVSGPGGGPFEDACRGSDVLIGFNYIAGKAMNTIAGVCQAQNNGVLVGANYGLNTQGKIPDDGGIYPIFHAGGTPRCPAGQAIYEMRVWLDKYNEVNRVAATCTPLLENPHAIGTYLGETGTSGEATNSAPLSCEPGAIAIGITGRSGALIDGVGLKCATFPWHEPPPPVVTPPVPTPPATPQFVKVVASVDVYDMPDPPPGNARKGVLPAGTAEVTLVEKGPDHWYQLSWPGCPPQPNWVYSGAGPPDFVSLDPASIPGGP
jgi:hypothetical protein